MFFSFFSIFRSFSIIPIILLHIFRYSRACPPHFGGLFLFGFERKRRRFVAFVSATGAPCGSERGNLAEILNLCVCDLRDGKKELKDIYIFIELIHIYSWQYLFNFFIPQSEKRIFWRAIARNPANKSLWMESLRLLSSFNLEDLKKTFKMMAEKGIRLRTELGIEVEVEEEEEEEMEGVIEIDFEKEREKREWEREWARKRDRSKWGREEMEYSSKSESESESEYESQRDIEERGRERENWGEREERESRQRRGRFADVYNPFEE